MSELHASEVMFSQVATRGTTALKKKTEKEFSVEHSAKRNACEKADRMTFKPEKNSLKKKIHSKDLVFLKKM